MSTTGINKQRRWLWVGLAILVMGGLTAIFLNAASTPLVAYQSKIVARNIRFPRLASKQRVNFFTGTAFAEYNLGNQSSRALTREFDLPEIEEIIWGEGHAFIKATDDRNLGELSKSSSLWWRIDFTSGKATPGSAPAQSTPPSTENIQFGDYKVSINQGETENQDEQRIDYSASLKKGLLGQQTVDIIEGTDQINSLRLALPIEVTSDAFRALLANQDNDLFLVSSDRTEVDRYPGVKLVLFPDRFVSLSNGEIEYDFISNRADVLLFRRPGISVIQQRATAMTEIKAKGADPHQLIKSWHEAAPGSEIH